MINTVSLTNEEVSSPVTIVTINNTVVDDKNAAVSVETDTSTFTCTTDQPAVTGKLSYCKL